MREVEVKFLEINVREIQEKLLSLGAAKSHDNDIHALYYDYPNHPMHKEGKLLRLRAYGDTTELVFKTKLSKEQAMIAQEDEVTTSDFETTKKILENLGLVVRREVKKHRQSFTLGNIHYEFDSIEGIPTFLEIEAQSVEELHQAIEQLGLNKEDAKPWSGRKVVEHYKQANN